MAALVQQKTVFKPTRTIGSEQTLMFKKMFSPLGCRQIWTRDGITKQFRRVFWCKSEDFTDKIDGFGINKRYDYYITKNSFFADKRETEYIQSLDNIVIDIDNHALNDKKAVDYEVDKLLYILKTDYQGKYPTPTLTVLTGRGVQLWISIHSIAWSMQWLYKCVVKGLCDRLHDIIKDNDINLSVDYNASCNAAGVVRLPYSYNTANGTYINQIEHTDIVYNVDDLIHEYDIEKCPKTLHKVKESVTNVADGDYTALHIKRINYIKAFVERCNGSVTGRRNTLIFLYYNACVQVHDHNKAIAMTQDLNNQFVEQYSDAELRTVINAVDKKNYKFSNETFFDMLELSSFEKQQYQSMSSYKPKIDKDARNKQIIGLAVQLKTCEDIANEVGCSVRTVKTILHDFDKQKFVEIQVKELRKTMTVKQVAESLKISVRTVQNLQKLC